ncbi:MAG: RNA-binding protein [Rhizobiaceae bacterium]
MSRARREKLKPRTCIVTKDTKEPGEMIRFVCDPNGNLVPDLKADLPGRGAWVSATKSMVGQAMERKLFAKALETKVEVSKTLDEDVGELLHRSVIGALAMANKAGVIVFGFSKVNDMIRSGKADLVLHANDAADDGIRKIGSALKAIEAAGAVAGDGVPITALFSTSDELESALGGMNIMHVGAKSGGATENVVKRLTRLQDYLKEDAA